MVTFTTSPALARCPGRSHFNVSCAADSAPGRDRLQISPSRHNNENIGNLDRILFLLRFSFFLILWRFFCFTVSLITRVIKSKNGNFFIFFIVVFFRLLSESFSFRGKKRSVAPRETLRSRTPCLSEKSLNFKHKKRPCFSHGTLRKPCLSPGGPSEKTPSVPEKESFFSNTPLTKVCLPLIINNASYHRGKEGRISRFLPGRER